MTAEVASRELRNDTAGVLRRVQGGEDVVVTVNGRPAVRIIRITPELPSWIDRDELLARLRLGRADAGLAGDLARLAGDTTEDLGPLG
jgi:prevent-host-death family protein